MTTHVGCSSDTTLPLFKSYRHVGHVPLCGREMYASYSRIMSCDLLSLTML